MALPGFLRGKALRRPSRSSSNAGTRPARSTSRAGSGWITRGLRSSASWRAGGESLSPSMLRSRASWGTSSGTGSTRWRWGCSITRPGSRRPPEPSRSSSTRASSWAARASAHSPRWSSSSPIYGSGSRRKTAAFRSAWRSWAASARSGASTTSSTSRRKQPWVRPVIDFAHLHAVTDGAFTTVKAFHDVLSAANKTLPRGAPFHIHFSDIAYANRNESKHLPYGEGTLRAEPLGKALARFARPATVITESPDEESNQAIRAELFAVGRSSSRRSSRGTASSSRPRSRRN